MESQVLRNSAKARVDRALVGDVAIDQGGRVQRRRQRAHPLLEGVALIGEGQLGAGLVERLGDAPGDGPVIGDAHDEAAFALHEPDCGHALILPLTTSRILACGQGNRPRNRRNPAP